MIGSGVRSVGPAAAFALLALLSGAMNRPALSAVVHVPADEPTLQAGIDAAASGDTVLVAPGSYTGQGNRNLGFGGRDVLLKSEDGPEETILDGGLEDARAFRIDGGEAPVIDGFTMRRFAPLYEDDRFDGGGMLVLGSAPTVRNCVFEENNAASGNGGGVYAEGGEFEGCVFRVNSAGGLDVAGWGGGIYAAGAGILDCRIEGNRAHDSYAGGIHGVGGGAVLFDTPIEGCTVVNNAASIAAGLSVRVSAGGAYIYCCTIANNYTTVPGEAGGVELTCGETPASFLIQQTILWADGHCGNPEVVVGSVPMNVSFVCSLVDPDLVVGEGGIAFGPHCLEADPLFCRAKDCDGNPADASSYDLQPESPARGENSPCHALIGASDAPCVPSGVSGTPAAARIALGPPVPNPAREEIRCALSLPAAAPVLVEAFDVYGRRVRTLFHGAGDRSPGSVGWDLRDANGTRVPAGVYFIRLSVPPGLRESRTVVVSR